MRRVALVSAGTEGDAAYQWLASRPDMVASRVPSLREADLRQFDVLWVHATAGDSTPGLLPWLQRGGRLLLTLNAATLPAALGIEPTPPDDVRETTWRHESDEFWLEEYRSFLAFPHIRGLAAYGPHPLFRGLDQGSYTWAPSEGERYRWVTYRAARPASGHVVAVERSFIHLNPERQVAWEYEVGDGGILCIGAFVHLAAPDPLLAAPLRAVLGNALAGDGIPHATRPGPASPWPPKPSAAPPPIPLPAIEPPSEIWDEWPASGWPLSLEGPVRADEPWTLAGRRVLVVGGERTGIREVWAHPWRVVRDTRLLVNGREPDVISIRVAPDEIVRVLRAGGVECTERVTTALEHGLVAVSIECESPVSIEFRWRSDFRRMWPYPAREAARFRVARAATGNVTAVRIGPSGDSPRLEGHCHEGQLEAPERADEWWSARGEGRLRLVLLAGGDERDTDHTAGALRRRGLRAIRQERVIHARRIGERLMSLETPDQVLNRGFEWAKVRLDSFLAETPGLGRSLLAGYGASRPGWGDGRPGYAWYFGRDSCWSAFATLAMGDRDIAKDVFRFLARHQDVTGKVLHEYTTSGLVHYDAADSTPLFLLLAGRLGAWSGDLAYLDRYWAAIEGAVRFCLATDTDGDGLIENHRVGHGWIEHGPLGGLFATLYLAACWVAALESLVPVARGLGRDAFAAELAERAAVARAAVARRFRTAEGWALGIEPDGKPRVHRTAMLSVPLLLGVVPPDTAADWYDVIASPRFSAPWGVRMIASDDPLFDPSGYHQGAVWPLYTGWVSQAEWVGGRWEAALGHLRATAGLVDERARGAFDEVLHGLERRGAGICPDQAWSAAMAVSPAVEGLWGIAPDALAGAVSVSPWLPDDWNEMALRRLRVGVTMLDLRLRRRPGRQVLQVARLQGPPIRLTASLRSRAPVLGVALNDEPLGGGRAVFLAGVEDEVQFLVE